MARPIDVSAAATVKIIIVKICPIKLSITTELIKNKKEIANNINSMDINMIIRLLLLSTIPKTPKINNIVPTVKYS